MLEVKRHLVRVLFPQIQCYALNVRHNFHGIFEHVGVDPLEDVGLEFILIVAVGYFVCRIDVAEGDGIVGIDGIRQTKMFAYLFNVLNIGMLSFGFIQHARSRIGYIRPLVLI